MSTDGVGKESRTTLNLEQTGNSIRDLPVDSQISSIKLTSHIVFVIIIISISISISSSSSSSSSSRSSSSSSIVVVVVVVAVVVGVVVVVVLVVIAVTVPAGRSWSVLYACTVTRTSKLESNSEIKQKVTTLAGFEPAIP